MNKHDLIRTLHESRDHAKDGGGVYRLGFNTQHQGER